jgi:hypothetical protein
MNDGMARSIEDPIFGEPEEVEPDAKWGILIGGMASYDEELMAKAYKEAADMLVEQALRSGDRSWEVAPPILFLYRHSVELHLKLVVQPEKRNHSLAELVEEASEIAQRRGGNRLPDWAKARLLEFANYDPRSTSFRYADRQEPLALGECWIDLDHLRRVMGVLTTGLAKLATLPDSGREGTP